MADAITRMPGPTDLVSALNAKLASDSLRVPPYPAIATRLQRMLREERFGLQEVSNVIASDAALAAVVLREASSAGIGMASTTLGTAVMRLGVDAVIRLALAATIGMTAAGPGPLATLRRDRWRRSLLSALACQHLAGGRGVGSEHAFLGGLLHDFGAVVVVSTLESMAGARGLPVLPLPAWNELVEKFHVRAGSAVARKWQLPEPIASAIAHHHAPSGTPAPDRALVELVAIVDETLDLLDAAPERGVSVLEELSCLTPIERRRLATVMPVLADHMATLDVALPAASAPARQSAVVQDLPPDLVAVGFAVEAKGTTTPFRAVGISETTVAFTGRAALRSSSLATLTLRCEPAPITILATIKTCAADGSTYTITAQPFGLVEADRAIWREVVAQASALAEPAVVCG
jgi:HD-like signal output (HDOD) protein